MTDDDKALVENLRDMPVWPMEEAADRIKAQAAEIERLREALIQIAQPAFVSVGNHKHMYMTWREVACQRIDIARDALE